jgi:hypothetical protein
MRAIKELIGGASTVHSETGFDEEAITISYDQAAIRIVVNTTETIKVDRLTLFNCIGQCVAESVEAQIQGASLRSGIYLIRIMLNNGKYASRIFYRE